MNGPTKVALLLSFTAVVAIGAKGCKTTGNEPHPMKSAVQPAPHSASSTRVLVVK